MIVCPGNEGVGSHFQPAALCCRRPCRTLRVLSLLQPWTCSQTHNVHARRQWCGVVEGMRRMGAQSACGWAKEGGSIQYASVLHKRAAQVVLAGTHWTAACTLSCLSRRKHRKTKLKASDAKAHEEAALAEGNSQIVCGKVDGEEAQHVSEGARRRVRQLVAQLPSAHPCRRPEGAELFGGGSKAG